MGTQAGEISQLVKCLPHKHKALSSVPRAQIKIGLVTHHPSVGETGTSLALAGQPASGNLQAPGPSERPSFKINIADYF